VRVARYATLALLAASLGCAKRLYVRAPQATAPWRELLTAHFAVATDLPDREAAHVATELEQFLAGLAETMLHGVAVPARRISVVAFANGAELRAIMPPPFNGLYVRGVLDVPVIVSGGASDTDVFYDGIARHELAHYVIDLAFNRHLPEWFSEGSANLLETVSYDPAAQGLLVGRATYSRLETLRKQAPLPVRDVVGKAPDSRSNEAVERYYATAWLLVHYLVSRQTDAFDAFQSDLKRGVDGDEAFARAFSAETRAGLDVALAGYLASHRYEVSWRREWHPRPIDITWRPMSPSDVLAMRALVYAAAGIGGQPPPPDWRLRADQLAVQALTADRTNATALRVRAAVAMSGTTDSR
jgi:hypothetical protein